MTAESDERPEAEPRDDERDEAAPPPDEPADETVTNDVDATDEAAVGEAVDASDAAGASDDADAGEAIEGVVTAETVPTDESPEPDTVPTGDVMRAHLKGLIEALVFVSDQPLTLNDLAKAAKADRKLVRALLDELKGDYAGRGVRLEEVANGFVFRTSAVYAPFIRDSVAKKPVRMTRAQLETLAIVAYRQPITRPEIDDIRGVDSGPVLKMLLERDLVRILGKKDEPGRPLLYGTTPQFLQFFGLKSLKDLPTLREFTELSDDSRRVLERELGDAADEAPRTVTGVEPMADAPAEPMPDATAEPMADATAEAMPDGAPTDPNMVVDPLASFDAPTDPGSPPVLSDDVEEVGEEAETMGDEAVTDPDGVAEGE